MNIAAFTLGMLSVIVIAFVVALVWGIVKVVKQQKQIEYLQQFIDDQINNLWRQKDEDRRALSDREYQLHQNLDRRFEDLERQRIDTEKNLRSYIDSRIDRIDSKSSKKLLKG